MFYLNYANKNNLISALYLNGLKVVNCDNVIVQKKNSYVQLLNSVFIGNQYLKTGYEGAVVYHQETSCAVDVSNCYFYNNYGNNITSRGKTLIDNCLFKITDVKYTYQPEPFVLEQLAGEGVIKNCQFYCNTAMDYSNGKMKLKAFNKNRSFAKISVRVGLNATVNGKREDQLRKDDSFNFYNAPYNNKSYVFSIY